MNLWRTIAKCEIRLKSSRLRTNRRLYFILIYSLALFWALYLGPVIIDAIIPEIIKDFSNQLENFIIQLVEYTFTTFFFMSVIYPLFVLFRKAEIDKKELLLATPARPGDIFLGEFMGQLPFYLVFILIIGPFGIALILQINPQMNIFHYLIFYFCFFTLSIFGSLIGAIVSNWVEHKFTSSKKLKNLGNISLFLIAVLVIIIFYIFHFVFDFIRNHPEFKNWFFFYPSFWYSNIILYSINPTYINSYILNIWANLSLAILIPILVFYLSYKKAYIFYDLRLGTQKDSKFIEKIKFSHKLIKKITLTKYKKLVVVQFKSFLRKRENLTKLIYIIGTISILGIFIMVSFENQAFSFTLEPLNIPIIFQITFNKNIIAIIIAWMGGLIFGLLVGMYDFIGSKELLFAYKKTPKGTKSLFYSFLYSMLYILISFDIVLTLFFSLVFQLDIFISLLFFFTYIVNSTNILLQAIGFQCIRPLFEERRKNLITNNYLILLLHICSFLLTLFIFIPTVPDIINPYLGLIYIILISLGISSAIASVMFIFGIRNLNSIE